MLSVNNFRLQFITNRTERFDELESSKLALEGGCRWIQLRMKNAPLKEIEAMALKIREYCRKKQATFIIDDHVELVRKTGADGVHIGKTDMPVAEARQILGNDIIIGATANTFDDIQAAVAAGADYIGLGPFRFTKTKQNLSPILGIDGYKSIVNQCEKSGINIPIVAIGGITADDVSPLMQTGINGVAISGAILQEKNPVAYVDKIDKVIKNR